MSQTRWQALFRPAKYGPVVNPAIDPVTGMMTDPSRTLLDPGDLAPQDLVGHEVRHYLAQDPVLRSIFKGDRIEYMPARNPLDFRQFPRLQVYLTSNVNSERPTAIALEELSVYVGVRADQHTVEPIADGAASVASVLARVKRVMRALKASRLVIWRNGTGRYMVMDMRVGGEQLLVDAVQVGAAERVAMVHEVQFTWRIDIDKNTGQIDNLQ